MCHTLSHDKFLLTVLNQLRQHKVEHCSFEQELQTMLVELAERVKAGLGITPSMLDGNNSYIKLSD